jgi:glycosyltransferase involved in cell wall biosynthesis
MKPSGKRLIVVLGMHRCGTSVIARALNVLGVDIGNSLIPASEGINNKGFFEDVDINSLNVEILRTLGNDWHSVAKIEPLDLDVLHKSGYFLRAVTLLRRKTADVPIFGFKDPRLAKLLPFWCQVFSHCEFDTRYVLIVRNPLSVVQSLAKRDGLPAQKSHMLWLGHVLSSLLHSQGHRRVLLDYDHFLENPQEDLNLVSDRLELQIDAQAFQRYQLEFLDEGLRHTAYESSELALDQTCPPIVQEIYAELLTVSHKSEQLDDPAFHARAALWANEFDRFNSNLRWIDSLNQSIDRHGSEITELILSVLKQDPNALRQSFNSEWYLERYPDVAVAGIDPYQHYISAGAREGRLPSKDIPGFVCRGLSERLQQLNVEIGDAKMLSQSRLLEMAELENRYLGQLQEIQRAHEQQRDELSRHLANREQVHVVQVADARREIEGHLTELTKRAAASAAELQVIERAREEQIIELNRRHSDLQHANAIQLTEARREVEGYLSELKRREEAHAQQLQIIERVHEHRIVELNRRHADLEQSNAIQFSDARREIEGYLSELSRREEAYAEQLRLIEQFDNQRIEELDYRHADRERIYVGQLTDAQRVIEGYLSELKKQEKAHAEQLRHIEQTHQQRINEAGRQSADRERTTNALLRAKHDRLDEQANRLVEVERTQTQKIAQLHLELSAIRITYSWRVTAPLRKLASLLWRKKPGRPTEHSPAADEMLAEKKVELGNPSLIAWVPLDSTTMASRIAPSLNPARVEAATLDDLLSWDDVRFLHGAYGTFLRRAPDPEGLRYYLARLRAGAQKITILGEIVGSPEGAANAVELPGLREIVILHKLSSVPIIGRLLVGSFFSRLKANSNLGPRARTSNFNGLLEYDDRKFVESAYLMFLGRHPDPDGLNFYRDRLRSGVHKIQIIGEILGSPEAIAKGVDAWGWRAIVKLHDVSRSPLSPLIGRLLTTPTIAGKGNGGATRADVREGGREIIHPAQLDKSSFKSNGADLAKSGRDIRAPDRANREIPLISVVMPVYKTPIELLRCAVTSVVDQSFANWELCICDDGSNDPNLRKWLLDYAQLDNRIKIGILDENVGISSATNKAVEIATGQYIAFLDHDDALTPDALAEVASAISANQDVDVLYTDQDKIDEAGAVFEAFHKPDWSPDYFRRVMYVGHLLVVRAGLVRSAGGFRAQYNRVQDYEFLLRVSEVTSKIVHIRKVLYHWRAIEGSIAATPNAKGEIESLQCEAVRAHLERIGFKREVLPHPIYAHRVMIKPIKGPENTRVSIVIPSKNRPEHIGRCLRSIFGLTSYKNYEVIVVDNGTTDREALQILGDYPVKVIPFDEPFNYSKANNLGVACSTGDVIVLLNNDTEVITGDWIEILLANLEQDDVGAVGPMLLYPDMTVQHAGIVLGPRGTADHVMRTFPWQSDGYAGSLSCVREVSGVTGACLMTRKEAYTDIGGLVEHFGTHYQDVDYCLRVRAQGKRILHVPDVQLIHYEGATRGSDYDLLDRLLLQDTWARELGLGDPYFNPAFSLIGLDYSLNSMGKEN